MKNEIKCRPYKVYIVISVIFVLVCVMLAAMSIFAISEKRIADFLIRGIACVGFGLLARFCYNMSKITLSFESDGLTMRHIKGKKEMYISYQDYPYGCFCKSYRGHLYLVFSPDKLQEKQYKKIVNRSVWTNSIFVKRTIVFMINNISEKDRELIKTIVSEKIFILN